LAAVQSLNQSLAGARAMLVPAFVFVITVCGAGCARTGAQGGQKPTAPSVVDTGAVAPDFSAFDLDGNRVTLSQFRGKDVVLLNFWSTWCEPCVAELPHLRSLYKAKKDQGFVMLAISVDGPETVANVPGFARRNQLEFPLIIDEDSHIANLYNPKRTAPVSVLIGRSGRIAAVHQGYLPGDEEALGSDVAKALDGPHATR